MGDAPRGRPRGFDEDEALDQLVVLFWQQGYEHTNHADMRAATGLSGSSLYNTFGDKRAIFDAVLERYLAMSEGLIGPLVNGDTGLQSIIDWLDFVTASIRAGQAPPGCLVVSTMAQPVGQEPDVHGIAVRYMERLRRALRSALVRAVELGEQPAASVESRLALVEGAYVGALTTIRANPTPESALAILTGARDTVEGWLHAQA